MHPEPAELNGSDLDDRKLASRLGRAVADQHPGVQIAESVTGDEFEFDLKHPAHDWYMHVVRGPEDNATTLENKAKRKAMAHYIDQWQHRLVAAMHGTKATGATGEMPVADALRTFNEYMRRCSKNGRKAVFIGNGGSSAIAGHMAEDWTKNGGVRSVTFNDPALLTCFANDYGWDTALAHCIEKYADLGDVLVAISSSGRSASITNACNVAKEKMVHVITFSGFSPDNPLRQLGVLNFHVPSHQYGFVETAHAAWLHAALDIHMGWVGQL